MKTRLGKGLLPFLLFLTFPMLNVIGLHHKRLTYDEGRHYDYGMSLLSLNSDRVDDSKMPFSVLNAAPRKLWSAIEPWPLSRSLRTLGKMRTGRYVTIFFALLVAYFVHRWAKELYGPAGGAWALLLYTFCPNVIAHSRLITTDMFCAGMVTISLYYFWRFLKEWGRHGALLSAVTLALSQVAKYSCVLLYPIFFLIVLFSRSPFVIQAIKRMDSRSVFRGLRSFFKYCLLFLIVSLFIINLAFLFNKPLVPFGDYLFQSQFFKTLQASHPLLRLIPVPLPSPYLEGLDWSKYNEDTGKGYGPVYLLGKIKSGEGFKGYYFYAFFYKVPLATQILFVLALFWYARHFKRFDFLKNEIFLLLPILFFTLYFNFFFQAHIGIRYFLPVFPLLHIFCGTLFKSWETCRPKLKAVYACLALYLIVSVLSYTLHYLSYFNEFVWDRKQAYKILADSNIDWGENTWYLEAYQKKHPQTIVSPDVPVSGNIVVAVNDLTGVTTPPEKYQWLRDSFDPIGHIAYSYLIYHVSPEALKSESS